MFKENYEKALRTQFLFTPEQEIKENCTGKNAVKTQFSILDPDIEMQEHLTELESVEENVNINFSKNICKFN